jgi:two-component system LytT family sensor kinase
MKPVINRFFSEAIKGFNHYKIYHFIFWVIYIGFWSVLIGSDVSWRQAIISAWVFIFFHILVSYFNNYFLIEWFLFRRQYIAYFLSLFLSILLVCFPLAIASYLYVPLTEESIANIWTLQFFIYNFLTILFTVLLTASIKLFRNWFLKEQTNKELQKLNIENELRFLKSQINPHFLFNNLNNLYALTLKNSELAPDAVLKLSNILRFGLYESQKQKVPIEDDIQFVRDYIELEKLRLGDRTDIQLEVEGSTFGQMIEPFLFINFIENAFKHGANPSLGKSYIHIKYLIDTQNHQLIFSISNNKPGALNNLDKDKVGGIGLKNVQTRLNILYPGKHQLNIVDNKENYSVTLILQTV